MNWRGASIAHQNSRPVESRSKHRIGALLSFAIGSTAKDADDVKIPALTSKLQGGEVELVAKGGISAMTEEKSDASKVRLHTYAAVFASP